MPGITDNALVKAGPMITSSERQPEPKLTPEVEGSAREP